MLPEDCVFIGDSLRHDIEGQNRRECRSSGIIKQNFRKKSSKKQRRRTFR
ncbi:MAG: hypothetical protein ACLUJR_13870 [Mediterraneibacter gnavus]